MSWLLSVYAQNTSNLVFPYSLICWSIYSWLQAQPPWKEIRKWIFVFKWGHFKMQNKEMIPVPACWERSVIFLCLFFSPRRYFICLLSQPVNCAVLPFILYPFSRQKENVQNSLFQTTPHCNFWQYLSDPQMYRVLNTLPLLTAPPSFWIVISCKENYMKGELIRKVPGTVRSLRTSLWEHLSCIMSAWRCVFKHL